MVRSPKVAIVVLNYLNDNDTVECVESTFSLEGGPYDVIVVDNASTNGAYDRLQKRFEKDSRVTLLRSSKNLGFARGNNLGIRYARRKKKADFVLAINNDTVFTDTAYITKMLEAYEPGVGVLGSQVVLNGGKIQDRYTSCLGLKYCWLREINLCSEVQGASFDFALPREKAIPMLHGAVLLFTSDFFRYYTGLYARTFLYKEEEILYLMCVCHDLRQKYVDTTRIYHKEDQSSELSFGNDHQVKLKFYAQSYKWVLWWRLKAALLGKMPFDINK